MRITNGQETVKVLAHFCCNNSILGIESVKKEFIIDLNTVYSPSLFIKNLNRVYSSFSCQEQRMITMNNWHLLFLFDKQLIQQNECIYYIIC